MSKTTNKFSPGVRHRAIRMVLDHEAEHSSRWAAVSSIAAKIGCSPATLHEWVKKTEVDSGKRAGLPSDVAEKMKALERENRELRQGDEILRNASAYFAQALSANAIIRLSGKRRSTAPSSDDLVHRRTPWRVRGRADLQIIADCPVHLSRECRQAPGRGSPVDPRPQRYRPEDRDTPCLRAELSRLWRS
jgi:transposase